MATPNVDMAPKPFFRDPTSLFCPLGAGIFFAPYLLSKKTYYIAYK